MCVSFKGTVLESAKVAVIGTGNWGKNLVRNFAHLGALAMVCDVDPRRLENVKREYTSVRVTDQFDAVLTDPEIKAIVIATPIRAPPATWIQPVTTGRPDSPQPSRISRDRAIRANGAQGRPRPIAGRRR